MLTAEKGGIGRDFLKRAKFVIAEHCHDVERDVLRCRGADVRGARQGRQDARTSKVRASGRSASVGSGVCKRQMLERRRLAGSDVAGL